MLLSGFQLEKGFVASILALGGGNDIDTTRACAHTRTHAMSTRCGDVELQKLEGKENTQGKHRSEGGGGAGIGVRRGQHRLPLLSEGRGEHDAGGRADNPPKKLAEKNAPSSPPTRPPSCDHPTPPSARELPRSLAGEGCRTEMSRRSGPRWAPLASGSKRAARQGHPTGHAKPTGILSFFLLGGGKP